MVLSQGDNTQSMKDFKSQNQSLELGLEANYE